MDLTYLISALGFASSSQIEALLIFIREDGVGPGLAVAIVILATLIGIVSSYYFFKDYLRIRRALKIIIPNAGSEEFAKNYNTINQDLSEVPVIGFAWSEFAESLVPPKVMDDGSLSPAANTVRPNEYLNLQQLGMGPRFSNVWPNVLIGIGLSLTFLGLISALSEATTVMQQALGDTAELQGAIQGLLNVASAKFYASLFALFSSIVLTLVLRIFASILQGQIDKLNGLIEGAVDLLGQESLLLKSNELLREQLAQLTTFNTDLAIKIGENITQALEPVLTEITANNEKMTQEQVGAMERMGQQMTETISGSTQEAMQQVAQKLEAVSEKLESLGEVLGKSLAGFDQELQRSMRGLSENIGNLLDSVSKDLESTVAGLAPSLEAGASAVASVIDEMRASMGQQAERSADIFGNAVDAATKSASDVIGNAGEEFARSFQGATSDLVQRLEAMTDMFRSLETSLSTLPSNLSNVNTELTTTARSVSTASTQFTSAATGMNAVIEPLAEFARSNRESIAEMTDQLNTISESIDSSSKNMEEAVSKLRDGVLERISEVDGAEQVLKSYLDSINESTERVLQSISSFVGETDEGFRSSIGVLNGAIEDFGEAVDNLASK